MVEGRSVPGQPEESMNALPNARVLLRIRLTCYYKQKHLIDYERLSMTVHDRYYLLRNKRSSFNQFYIAFPFD